MTMRQELRVRGNVNAPLSPETNFGRLI